MEGIFKIFLDVFYKGAAYGFTLGFLLGTALTLILLILLRKYLKF